jgi:hypothetical protein
LANTFAKKQMTGALGLSRAQGDRSKLTARL